MNNILPRGIILENHIDAEIIKDIIMEQNPTTTRSNIIFDNIYMSYNGESIMCPYRELVWSQQFSVTRLDYLNRYKEKQRMNKLNELI